MASKGFIELLRLADLAKTRSTGLQSGKGYDWRGVVFEVGDQRLVELREIAPSSMNEKDVNELAELFGELANSVLLVTALYKDKKAAGSKKSKSCKRFFNSSFSSIYSRPLKRNSFSLF